MRSRLAFAFVFLAANIFFATAKDNPLQTLRGTLLPCDIDVPSTWKVLPSDGNRVAALGDGMSIILSSDPHNLGDCYASVKADCEGARKAMPDATWTAPRPVKVAQYEWLEFTITATLEGAKTTFLNYTYSGHPGTFTIVGVAHTDHFAQKRDSLIRYMKTFRFPKAAPNSSGGGP